MNQKKIDIQHNRVYKTPRRGFDNNETLYYIIFYENNVFDVYLTYERNKEIYSKGTLDIDSSFWREVLQEDPPILCEVNEEAKVRLMISIFESQNHDYH